MISKEHLIKIVEYYGRSVKGGAAMTTWDCPHCERAVLTTKPKRDQVSSKGYWDSATICMLCGKVSFVCVYPNGRTTAKKFGK